jgi:NADH-quinone oxidoreductase subunit G
LIEPSSESGWQYSTTIPAAFRPAPEEWLFIPIFHIFGSEELSRHAQGISQLVARPYVAFHPVEASRHGLKAGEQVKVVVEGTKLELAVVLRADMPRGVAGLSAGVSSIEGITLPGLGKVAPTAAELSARGAA